MTEYWVSQGNKWCDHCKIFIANNAASIRTHEFGQRHKENVAKRVAAIRKDTATKEKEQLQAKKDLTRIEAQALKSYEKDLAAVKKGISTPADSFPPAATETPPRCVDRVAAPSLTTSKPAHKETDANEWVFDQSTGYHYNAATGYFYDPNTGLYYSDILGKWTTQEEALKASQEAHDVSPDKTSPAKVATVSATGAPAPSKPCTTARVSSGPKPPSTFAAPASNQTSCSSSPRRPVQQTSSKVVRGVASSLKLGKRRRESKPKPVSSAEAAALAAREAARKRTEEREKALLGLYQAY